MCTAEAVAGENGKFGFDTNHILMSDISPFHETNIRNHPAPGSRPFGSPIYPPHYWTFDEVKAEVIGMAAQFKRRESRVNVRPTVEAHRQ